MSHREKRLDYLWKVFQEKRATPEEAKELQQYFASRSPKAMIRFMKSFDEDDVPDPLHKPTVDPETLIQRAMEREERQSQQLRQIRNNFLTAAAVAISVFATCTIFYYSTHSAGNKESATVHTPPKGIVNNPPMKDSSKVLLSPGAAFHYQQLPNARKASLTGRGYFKINSNKNHPYSIQTQDITIVVLGTSFAVNTHPGGTGTTVALESGAVKIVAGGKTLTELSPGQLFVYERSTGTFRVEQANMEQELAFLGGDIGSSSIQTYQEVAQTLSERFGTEIRFSTPSLSRVQLHMSRFRSTSSLDEILSVLTQFSGTHYTRENNLVTISQ